MTDQRAIDTSHPPDARGLSGDEATRRLLDHGPNELPAPQAEPGWRKIIRQFRSPLIYILLAALAIDTIAWFLAEAEGVPFEAVAIALILLGNAGLGVWQERKAEEALSKLGALTVPMAWVYRDGVLVQMPTRDLVPGDVLRVSPGDRIPADGELQSTDPVRLDASVLTGESVPIDKIHGDELPAGTLLVQGEAVVTVTRTGAGSAMGRLAELLGTVQTDLTPLGKRLQRFGNRVARWVLALAVALVAFGIWTEGVERLPTVVLFAVALAVAAVPEGLPAVLTVTLALGVERMARRQAVVRRLDAVEALGSVTVIATDKTGTLTENRMEVQEIDSPDRDACLRAMALVNDADPESEHGDPTEVALRKQAARLLGSLDALTELPRVGGRPFDPAWKFMRVTVREGQALRSYFKGAPEEVLSRCRTTDAERTSWAEKIRAHASEGHRVIGFATGDGEAEEQLTWLGLAVLWDPPRPEVPEAVRRTVAAGIRIIMITGDHPETALGIARKVGIGGDRVVTGSEVDRASPEQLREEVRHTSVFGRVTPEHKLRIVEALQASGEVVAVTGDGINDAPALRRADIGVAMGQRGSDVSREAADLVLLDDNFASIVAAIEEGRSIYANIQKFIRFLFSTNLSEIVVVVFGLVAAFALDLRDSAGALLLPLTAVQLLWINLVSDGAPALALGMDRNPAVLELPPRDPGLPLLDRASIQFILPTGVFKGAIALGVLWYLPRVGYGTEVARTAAFTFLAAGQLLFAYPARHIDLRPLTNPWLHAAVFAGILMQFSILWLAPFRHMLDAVALPWPIVLGILVAMVGAWGVAELTTRWLHHHWTQPAGSPRVP